MLGYLKKFNGLPAELKQKVSSPRAMAIIEALEKKYHLALAALIMKVMVKEVGLNDLTAYLRKENLTETDALALAKELKEQVFNSLGDYLIIKASPTAVSPGPAKFKACLPTMEVGPVDEPIVKGASFFFSPDDEAEIRELTKKIDTEKKTEVAAEKELPLKTIEEKLKEIIGQAKINFGSAVLADRFSSILKTYLLGIRNKLEVKSTLIKPFSNGGLSFDEESAQKIMVLADRILSNKPDQTVKNIISYSETRPPKPGISSDKPVILRDAPYDFSKLKKQADKIKADLEKLDTEHELAVPRSTPAKPLSKPKSQTPANPPSEAAADAGLMPLIKRRFEAENLGPSQRIRVEDVKYVPKVMGPLDEIKYLDLINFRRLDKDPVRATEKIKTKIDLLEEEGYGKRFEGIKSWRSSPLNKLYLQLGQISIGSNKPIDVIIEERKMKNLQYLSSEEFKAIMDLNKRLRF
jgi:hypothetical protein